MPDGQYKWAPGQGRLRMTGSRAVASLSSTIVARLCYFPVKEPCLLRKKLIAWSGRPWLPARSTAYHLPDGLLPGQGCLVWHLQHTVHPPALEGGETGCLVRTAISDLHGIPPSSAAGWRDMFCSQGSHVWLTQLATLQGWRVQRHIGLVRASMSDMHGIPPSSAEGWRDMFL